MVKLPFVSRATHDRLRQALASADRDIWQLEDQLQRMTGWLENANAALKVSEARFEVLIKSITGQMALLPPRPIVIKTKEEDHNA